MLRIAKTVLFSRIIAGGLFLALIVGLVGCGGGPYAMEEGELAVRYLPTKRVVEHHPDSLRALKVVEQDGQVTFELDRSYRSIVEKWSVGHRYPPLGPDPDYATFRSLELALASLQAEREILSLQPSRAQELIQKRRASYADTIKIDVYDFSGQQFGGPEHRAKLHIADSTYHPAKKVDTPRQKIYTPNGRFTYRRYTNYFPRVVDGVDLLEKASGAHLEIQRHDYHDNADQDFIWEWGGSQNIAQAEDTEDQ